MAPCFGQDPIRVLMLGDNGHHKPSDLYRAIREPLRQVGIELEYSDDIKKFLQPEVLAKADALLVYANIEKIEPEQESALLNYVENGGGFVPVHCASFCFQNSPKLIALTGAQFKSLGGERFATEIVEPEHEIM